MTTALLLSRDLRRPFGISLGFDANGSSACSDLGMTSGLNFLGFLSIGCETDTEKSVVNGTWHKKVLNNFGDI